MHLTNLMIFGFRGIEQLSIPRLGRVTLLAGRNSVGKTTVLDAVRIFAARGHADALLHVLEDHDEIRAGEHEGDDETPVADLSALFHGRGGRQSQEIAIGPKGGDGSLWMREVAASSWSEQEQRQLSIFSSDIDAEPKALRLEFGGRHHLLPWNIETDLRGRGLTSRMLSRVRGNEKWASPIECVSLGPGLLNNQRISRFWDNIVLTESDEFATSALRVVLGGEVERVAVIGAEPYSRWAGRRMVVKLNGHPRPVPLKSLGDGAARLFSVALALANSRGGFLLIDEAENGIHYSVQPRFWDMVLRTAHRHDIQVLATTHSSDCIAGFAQAAMDNTDVEGTLVRLDRDERGLRAVPYSEKGLKAAADQGIEVR